MRMSGLLGVNCLIDLRKQLIGLRKQNRTRGAPYTKSNI
jgi:hypothetical protein